MYGANWLTHIKPSRQTAIFSVFIIALLLSGAFIYALQLSPVVSEPTEEDLSEYVQEKIKNELIVSLQVSQIRDGVVIDSRYKEEDLILNNFWKLLGLIMNAGDSDGLTTFVDSSNVQRTQKLWGTSPSYGFGNVVTGGDGGYGQFGTGTTAPAVTDYVVQIPLLTPRAITGIPAYSNGNITFSYNNTLTGNANVAESVIYIKSAYTSGISVNFAVMRDTFTPIAGLTNDIMKFDYTIMLGSTGLTDNFGKLLAGYFREIPSGSQQVTLTDTLGISRLTSIRINIITNAYLFDNVNQQIRFGGAIVGTGTTAFSLSDYKLDVPIGEYTQCSSVLFFESNKPAICTDVSVDVATTLKEVGYYLTGYTTAGEAFNYMIFRTLVPDYSIDHEKVTVKFTIT